MPHSSASISSSWLSDLERIKYEKANKDVIQQNIFLQSQLKMYKRQVQEDQKESMDAKQQLGQLYAQFEQLSYELEVMKKEIRERVPALHLVAEHLQKQPDNSLDVIGSHIRELASFLEHISSSAIFDEEMVPIAAPSVGAKDRSRHRIASNLPTIDENAEEDETDKENH